MIKENLVKQRNASLNANLKAKLDDTKSVGALSQVSRTSKKSLNASELAKFFNNKKKEAEEDAKSRISYISRGSHHSGFK